MPTKNVAKVFVPDACKKRKITLIISTGLIIILLVILFVTTLYYLVAVLNDQTQKRVVVVVNGYAKQECFKQVYAEAVCNNLKVEVVPPPDWGSRSYLAYIYKPGEEQFYASLSIDIENGQPLVTSYEKVKYESSQELK